MNDIGHLNNDVTYGVQKSKQRGKTYVTIGEEMVS